MALKDLDNLLQADILTGKEKSSAYANGLTLAFETNPDVEAQKQKLQKTTGIPAALMDDETKQLAELQNYLSSKGVTDLPTKAPLTANWISQQENANVAHDDIESLAALEALAKAGPNAPGAKSTLRFNTEQDQGRVRSVSGAFMDALKSSPDMVAGGLAEPGVWLGDFVEWSLRPFADPLGQRKAVADALRESAAYWDRNVKMRQKEYRPGSPEAYAQQIGGSVGTSVLALPYALAGEGAALGAFALSAKGGYQDMVDSGTSVPMAIALSGSSKAMEGLTEKIGLDALYGGKGPIIKKAVKFLLGDLAGEEVNTLYNLGVAKVTVNPDMTMEQVVQQLIDTAIVTAFAGPIQGGTMGGVANASQALFDAQQKRATAKDQEGFLLALGDSVRGTKTFKRMPEKVQALIQEIKKDGAVQDIYIPVEHFNELFQSQGMSPEEAALQILSDPSRYDAAVATGSDIAIPLEEFAKLADAPYYAELARNSKTHFGSLSAREAEELDSQTEVMRGQLMELAQEDNTPAEETPENQAFRQKTPEERAAVIEEAKASLAKIEQDAPQFEELQNQLAEYEKISKEKPGQHEAYQRIHDDTYEQLLAVGRPVQEARDHAQVRATALSTLAEQHGYDYQDLMKRFPVKVTNGGAMQIPTGPFAGKTYEMVFSEGTAWVKEENARRSNPEVKIAPREQQFRDMAEIDAADIETNATNAEALVIDGHKKKATVSANTFAHRWYLDAGYPADAVVSTLRNIAKGKQLTDQQQVIAADWVESNKALQAKFLTGVTAGDLQEGDEFTAMLDDKVDDFTVVKVDNSTGEVTLKDGVVKTVDFFDSIEIVGGIAGVTNKEAEADPEDTRPVTMDDYFALNGAVVPSRLDQGGAESPALDDVLADLEQKFPDMNLAVFESKGQISVNRIQFPKEQQGQGNGSAVMTALTDYADATGQTITLTPSSDFGGTKSRVISFNKRFGFVENKGKNKDFAISDTMYRLPKKGMDQTLFQRGSAEGHETFSVRKTQEEGMLLTATVTDGVTKVSGIGATHYDASTTMDAKLPEGLTNGTGFVTPDGAFLRRKEAVLWLKENRPHAYQALDKITRVNGLESQAYAFAEGVVTGIDNSIEDFIRQQFGADASTLFQSQSLDKVSFDILGEFETGKEVTFNFVHNTQSATKLFGRPKRDSPHDRNLEPSGRYVTRVDKSAKDLPAGMIGGELTFRNPLVVKGESWKKELSSQFDNKTGKKLSLAIIEAGFDGVVTTAESKSGRYVSEILDLTTFDETKAMYQRTPGGKNAYIRFGGSLEGFEIGLLKDANPTSFLHELGHYYMEILGDLSEDAGAPEALKADYATLLKWVGAKDRASLSVEQLEQIARGYEAYHWEGKAPSEKLRQVFARISVWFKAVYKTLKELKVELTPEVREVFDRLLATDEEIAAAKQDTTPLYATAADAGMTPTVFAAYQKLAEQAQAEGISRLNTAKMRELLREQQQWWKDAREELQAHVEKEAQDNPVYQLLHLIHNGELFDGSPFEGGQSRLSGTMLKAQVDPQKMKLLRKKFGNVYVNEGGIDPQLASEMFGFSSVDEMVESLLAEPKMKTWVKEETDRRMEEQHGHMDPMQIAQEALDAVHNDYEATLLREELKAINKKRREVKPFTDAQKQQGKEDLQDEKAERRYERRWMDAEAKLKVAEAKAAGKEELDALKEEIRSNKKLQIAARNIAKDLVPPTASFKSAAVLFIAKMKVQEILPGKFAQAEQKAAKEAFKLNGQGRYEEAAQAKTRQLLNHYLYREATKAKEEAEAIAKRMRNLGEGKSQSRIGKAGQDYLDQVNGLLDQYEFAKVTNKELGARESLKAWVKRKTEESGFPPAIAPGIIEEANRINYKTLTVQSLHDVAETVDIIVHLSRVDGKIQREQEKQDIADLGDLGAESIAEHSRGKKKRHIEKRLAQDELGNSIDNYFASHRKLSSLTRQMDGGQDGGVMWNLYMRPLNEAADKEASMRAEAAAALQEIFTVYSVRERAQMSRREHIPALGDSLSKWGKLMVALNMGNDGNRQRLGSMFTPEQVAAIIDTLDERDVQFVQSVWDFIGSYWGEIEAKEKRVNGVAPQRVEPTPWVTKFGIKEGGYFPISYDAVETPKAGAQQQQEILQQIMGGAFSRATTRHGHTEARLEALDRPLNLSIDVVFNHVNQVIHDLTHHEVLYDVSRIMGTSAMQKAVVDHYGIEIYKVMTEGLRDIAIGDIPAQNAFERFMNYTRVGISTASLGYNLVTAMMQPMGLTQSIVRIGWKPVAKGLSRAIGTPEMMGKTAEMIYEKSSFMKTRGLTQNREINEIRNQLDVGLVPHAVRESFFYFIQQLQKVVDIPTWLGQYEKSMADHGDERSAVLEADQAVIDSQASGQMKDLARIQKGGAYQKMFTTFYSYFSTTYNLAVESKSRTDFKNPLEVGRFIVDMLMLYVVPVALTMALKAAINIAIGGDDDDKDGAEIAKDFAGESLGYLLGGFIGAREFGSILAGFAGYQGPAGARFYSDASKLAKELAQGELDGGLVKALNAVGGIIFHYPALQIQRTTQGIIEIKEGRGNALSLLFGKPRKN